MSTSREQNSKKDVIPLTPEGYQLLQKEKYSIVKTTKPIRLTEDERAAHKATLDNFHKKEILSKYAFPKAILTPEEAMSLPIQRISLFSMVSFPENIRWQINDKIHPESIQDLTNIASLISAVITPNEHHKIFRDPTKSNNKIYDTLAQIAAGKITLYDICINPDLAEEIKQQILLADDRAGLLSYKLSGPCMSPYNLFKLYSTNPKAFNKFSDKSIYKILEDYYESLLFETLGIYDNMVIEEGFNKAKILIDRTIDWMLNDVNTLDPIYIHAVLCAIKNLLVKQIEDEDYINHSRFMDLFMASPYFLQKILENIPNDILYSTLLSNPKLPQNNILFEIFSSKNTNILEIIFHVEHIHTVVDALKSEVLYKNIFLITFAEYISKQIPADLIKQKFKNLFDIKILDEVFHFDKQTTKEDNMYQSCWDLSMLELKKNNLSDEGIEHSPEASPESPRREFSSTPETDTTFSGDVLDPSNVS
jgi:hypothetical protein